MQATGNLVGILVELTAGVKLGHDDLGCRNAFFLMDIGRDTATVIGHRARPVGIQGDGYKRGMSCQRFIDRIVHDLVDHMMQAGAVIRVTDIHAGALTNSIQTFQNTNGIRAIFGGASEFISGISLMKIFRKTRCECSFKDMSNHATNMALI